MISPVPAQLYSPLAEHSDQRGHVVQFYDDDAFMCEAAGRFLEGAAESGEPIIIIATPDHRDGFEERLRKRGLDVQSALARGDVVMLDARATIDAIMCQDHPDQARFDEFVGGAIQRALAGRGALRVRAFGEMVDLLCRTGRHRAAVELEHLWNRLVARYPVSVFCACAMSGFAESKDGPYFKEICSAHSHAFIADRLSATDGTRSHLEAVAQVQQAALSRELDTKRKKESDTFRLLVESVKDYAIFMLDTRGVVTTWNAGAQRIKGYAAEEIIGRHFSCFYEPEQVAAGKCDWELEVALREGRIEDEGWRIRRDGTRFWASVVITALFSDSGQHLGFAKVTRDLTERRKAEDERVRLAQIQEANRVKDEFFAMISHELRTPLNAILGWATILQGKTDLNYIAKGLETIRKNAKTQKDLIEDMLDMSRIVAGTMRVDRALMDLTPVVRDVLDAMRPSADAKGVLLATEGLDETVMLAADPVRLRQVLSNLLSNAVKFTPAGGQVHVSLAKEGSRVELRVRDTGRGIAPGFLPYVFERFRQAENLSARSAGLGLGLAIVRHIVELHGGHITAASDGLHRGATFSVTLPIRAVVTDSEESLDQADISEPSRRQPPRAELVGMRVLVLEDEADARELLEFVLSAKGAKVRTFATADEARSAIKAEPPDVIISDIGMPNEDGYSFLRSIRRLSEAAGGTAPAIALTAYSREEDVARALAAGFTAHLAKPIDPARLLEEVQGLVRAHLGASQPEAPQP